VADTVFIEAFVGAKGWSDPAEEAALQTIAPFVRSKRVLDIGVGTGRTVPLMALLTDDYVGIDVSDEMVSACRRNYPDKDIRIGDARTLSDFQDENFDLVLFSFNGIDALEDRYRKEVLRAVHRVLDTDGLFLFSSLNKDGCIYAESPLQTHRPGQPRDRSATAAAHLLWRNGRDPLRLPRRYRNWRRTRLQTVDVDGWGTSALATSDFTYIAHFTTLSRLREEVSRARFDIVQIYGSDTGHRPIPTEKDATSDRYLYVLARKAAAAPST
jgi:SAM-dependent methyltransferase